MHAWVLRFVYGDTRLTWARAMEQAARARGMFVRWRVAAGLPRAVGVDPLGRLVRQYAYGAYRDAVARTRFWLKLARHEPSPLDVLVAAETRLGRARTGFGA